MCRSCKSRTPATNSGNRRRRQPFDTIRTDPVTRNQLQQLVLFHAVAGREPRDLHRHAPSRLDVRPALRGPRGLGAGGRTAGLDRPPRPARARQPECVPSRDGAGHPTSIDLLEPHSEILQATDRLPYRQGVPLHSIIGNDRWTCEQGRSDGVVAVSSAQLGGVQSEIFVDASHTEIQRRLETSQEVMRILLRTPHSSRARHSSARIQASLLGRLAKPWRPGRRRPSTGRPASDTASATAGCRRRPRASRARASASRRCATSASHRLAHEALPSL